MPKVTYSPGDVLTAADANDFCQEGFVNNASLDTTAGEPGGAWVAYTPTVTGISNTTATGAYCKLGKTVFFRAKVLLGASSSVTGTPEVTLPLASNADVPSSVFEVRMVDADLLRWYFGLGVEVNADKVSVYAARDNASSLSYSYGIAATSAIPFTWTTNDYIEISGTYQTT